MSNKVKILVCTLALSLGLTGLAVPAGAASVPVQTAGKGYSSCCRMHGGHSMELLAEITGKSVTELNSQYPQKTAWQAAKAMGKLDDLKKAYLARNKVMIDSLVDSKRISADDGAKMYADLQKRVAAIDGVNIVIPGRPTYMPKMDKQQ